MRLREYQWKTDEFAIFPKDRAMEYLALGLASEAGEVAGKVKKILRGDHGGNINAEVLGGIASEMGDVAWYLAQLATYFGLDLEDDVLDENIAKLTTRTARGVLKGSGDNR